MTMLDTFQATLPQLKDDKPTLSQCMRVAPNWNAIAGPILYHSLDIDFVKAKRQSSSRRCKNGFRGNPFRYAIISSGSGIPTKEQNLEHVRLLTMAVHQASECKAMMRGFGKLYRQRLILDTLKIKYSYSGLVSQADFASHCTRTPMGGPSECEVLKSIWTRRVVIFGTSPLNTVQPIPAKETVWVFNLSANPSALNRIYFSPNKTEKAVYIFWTSSPDLQYNRTWEISGRAYYNSRASPGYRHRLLRDQVVIDAWGSVMTKEVVIVNAEAINYQQFSNQDDNLATSLQKAVDEARPDDVNDENARSHLTFLTMQDYLKYHDWSGVFKPEDIKGWLEVIEKEQQID